MTAELKPKYLKMILPEMVKNGMVMKKILPRKHRVKLNTHGMVTCWDFENNTSFHHIGHDNENNFIKLKYK